MVEFSKNRCVRCGSIRALVALGSRFAPARESTLGGDYQDIADARIKKLEEKESKLTELVDKLLEHISSEAVYMSELRVALWKANEIINGGKKNE